MRKMQHQIEDRSSFIHNNKQVGLCLDFVEHSKKFV